MFDLSQEEWDTFAGAVAGIARQQERRPDSFNNFVAWLDRWPEIRIENVSTEKMAVLAMWRLGGLAVAPRISLWTYKQSTRAHTADTPPSSLTHPAGAPSRPLPRLPQGEQGAAV